MSIVERTISAALIGFAALLATACQNGDPHRQTQATRSPGEALSACRKADALWETGILPSRYETLPELTSPGLLDVFRLLDSHFSAKAFTADGDELEAGRRKLIHAFGVEARMRLAIAPDAPGGYTGILATGADCLIARFSLAARPTAETSTPALALKVFVSGEQPSLNLLLMHSVDGQDGHDFFAHAFSNSLPPARAFATRLLAAAFERSLVDIGALDTNPGRLTLEHLTSVEADGSRVARPRTPDQLLFVPTVRARALMPDAGADDDFRVRLAGLRVGDAVYDVLAVAQGESADAARPIGQLILTSTVVASRYGDERLFFRHHTASKPRTEAQR